MGQWVSLPWQKVRVLIVTPVKAGVQIQVRLMRIPGFRRPPQ